MKDFSLSDKDAKFLEDLILDAWNEGPGKELTRIYRQALQGTQRPAGHFFQATYTDLPMEIPRPGTKPEEDLDLFIWSWNTGLGAIFKPEISKETLSKINHILLMSSPSQRETDLKSASVRDGDIMGFLEVMEILNQIESFEKTGDNEINLFNVELAKRNPQIVEHFSEYGKVLSAKLEGSKGTDGIRVVFSLKFQSNDIPEKAEMENLGNLAKERILREMDRTARSLFSKAFSMYTSILYRKSTTTAEGFLSPDEAQARVQNVIDDYDVYHLIQAEKMSRILLANPLEGKDEAWHSLLGEEPALGIFPPDSLNKAHYPTIFSVLVAGVTWRWEDMNQILEEVAIKFGFPSGRRLWNQAVQEALQRVEIPTGDKVFSLIEKDLPLSATFSTVSIDPDVVSGSYRIFILSY